MSDWMQSGAHQELAGCFYDFAARRDGDVPEAVASDIRRRPFCRGRIIRLKEAVFGTGSRASKRPSPINRNVVDMLDSHFHYLDQPITCSQVRASLPGLLDPALGVRIPTPITVHLDQCPQCASDLRGLRKLALDGERLQRLQQLYEQEPAGGLLLCRRARSRIAAFVRGSLEGIKGEILSHLSTCPRCRADVYARRQAIINGLGQTPDGCRHGAAPADLFDYVVPRAGRVHHIEQQGASHVGTCRKCLEAIQAIHRAVYGIAERPESGVVTVYRTVGDGLSLSTRPDDPYAAYGVTVEVVRREPDRAPARRRTALKDATFNPRVRQILKTAVAAAAIIPLAAIYHYTHSGSGITVGKVLHAFERARNVRIVAYDPIADTIAYELWIARELNLLGMITEKECVICDLSRKEKDVGSGQIVPIDDVELANARGIADQCLGFRLADIPTDARWDRVSSDGNRDVYELTWMKRTRRDRMYEVKYEVAIDTSTMLPESLRAFRRESVEGGWQCRSLIVLEYMSEAEMISMVARKPVTGADSHR